MWNPIKKLLLLLLYLYRRYQQEGCNYRAASLAYTTLLSLVPLIIVGFTILSWIPAFHGVGERIQSVILENLVATSANVIGKYLTDFTSHVSRLSVSNLIFLIVIVLLMIYNINRAFSAIWHSTPRFHFSLSFLIYFVILFLSPILLGGVVVFGTFLIKLPFIQHLLDLIYLKRPLFFSLPYVLIFVTFTLFNWILPSCKVKLWHAMVGGGVTTVLFELAKYAFSLYLTHFSTYRLLYGALATIPIFLVWLYFSWTIILLGAVITNIMSTGISKNY